MQQLVHQQYAQRYYPQLGTAKVLTATQEATKHQDNGCVLQVLSQAPLMLAVMKPLKKPRTAGTSKSASTQGGIASAMTVIQTLSGGGIEVNIEAKAGIPHADTAHVIDIASQSTRKEDGDHAPLAVTAALPPLKTKQGAKEADLMTVTLLRIMLLMVLTRSEPKSGQCWEASDMPCTSTILPPISVLLCF